MKIPLSDQITEAILHRDALEKAVAEGKEHLRPRLNASEGIVLTLELYRATEADFRMFMETRR